MEKDYNYYLKVVEEGDFKLENVPEKFRTEEICLKVIENIGANWYRKEDYYMSDIFAYIPRRMLTRKFYLEAVRKNILAIRFMPKEYVTFELCLEEVRKDGYALGVVLNVMDDDRLILEAYKTNGFALKYLTNKESILEAVTTNINALKDIDKDFLTAEICMEAIKFDIENIIYTPKEFITEEVCLIAIERFKSSGTYDQELIIEDFLMFKFRQILACIPKNVITKKVALELIEIRLMMPKYDFVSRMAFDFINRFTNEWEVEDVLYDNFPEI